MGRARPCHGNQISHMVAPDSRSECAFRQGGNVSIFVVEVMHTYFQCVLLARTEAVTKASSDSRGGATYRDWLEFLQTGFKVMALVTLPVTTNDLSLVMT